MLLKYVGKILLKGPGSACGPSAMLGYIDFHLVLLNKWKKHKFSYVTQIY